MGDTLSYAVMRNFLVSLAGQIMGEKGRLDRMDAECGDGDFGSGMYIAFRNVLSAIEKQREEDIGILLKSAGDAVLSSAGGASGPLFGTLFIEAGRKAKGKSEISLLDLAEMFELSAQKVRARGGAKVGDKTLADSLDPAVDALKEAAFARMTIPLALRRTADAARHGAESTKSLVAKQGKARYLAEQTLGHQDPGAELVALMFETLSKPYSLNAS